MLNAYCGPNRFDSGHVCSRVCLFQRTSVSVYARAASGLAREAKMSNRFCALPLWNPFSLTACRSGMVPTHGTVRTSLLACVLLYTVCGGFARSDFFQPHPRSGSISNFLKLTGQMQPIESFQCVSFHNFSCYTLHNNCILTGCLHMCYNVRSELGAIHCACGFKTEIIHSLDLESGEATRRI